MWRTVKLFKDKCVCGIKAPLRRRGVRCNSFKCCQWPIKSISEARHKNTSSFLIFAFEAAAFTHNPFIAALRKWKCLAFTLLKKKKKPLRLQTVIVTRGDSLFLPPGIQFHPLFSNMTFKRQLIESKGQWLKTHCLVSLTCCKYYKKTRL